MAHITALILTGFIPDYTDPNLVTGMSFAKLSIETDWLKLAEHTSSNESWAEHDDINGEHNDDYYNKIFGLNNWKKIWVGPFEKTAPEISCRYTSLSTLELIGMEPDFTGLETHESKQRATNRLHQNKNVLDNITGEGATKSRRRCHYSQHILPK